MGLFQTRVVQRVTKPLGYWFSSANRLVGVLMISETGTLGIAQIPMHVGFTYSLAHKRAWRVYNRLACRIEGKEGRYLPVSERSMIPLDPNNLLTDEERKNLNAIDDIADREHDRVLSDISKSNQSERYKFLMRTILICGIILGGCLIFKYFKK